MLDIQKKCLAQAKTGSTLERLHLLYKQLAMEALRRLGIANNDVVRVALNISDAVIDGLRFL